MAITAPQAYNKEAAQVADNLARLAEMFETHKEAQAEHQNDWGYVGDLIYWNERLSHIRVRDYREDENAPDPFAGIVDVETNDGWDA